MSSYLFVERPHSLWQILPVSYLHILSHKIQRNWVFQVTRFPINNNAWLVKRQRLCVISPVLFHHDRCESSVFPVFLIQSCSVSAPKDAGAEPAALLNKCFITDIFFSLLQMWTANNGPPVPCLSRWHHAAATGEPGAAKQVMFCKNSV